MKQTSISLAALGFLAAASLTTASEREAVEKASRSYLEGFYEGDADKLSMSLDPSLLKHGFWKKTGSDTYEVDDAMTFDQALAYARDVKERKRFAKPDAPRKVEVLGVSDKIAITKVTAWWGVDYLMLAKDAGRWMIRQVLWEGPAQSASPTANDRAGVMSTGRGYLEGFYEGDSSKLERALRPAMFKCGYGLDAKIGEYSLGRQMTFDEALRYAKRVRETREFPKADAPKKVEVLDVANHIAALKVTAWWGIDYVLLSREGDGWKIEQVLWSGVPPT